MLRFHGSKIAAACIWLAFKTLQFNERLFTPAGEVWWAAKGVTDADLRGERGCGGGCGGGGRCMRGTEV